MLKPLKTFFKSELAIGVSLIVATLLAMLVANSSGYETYRNFFLIEIPLDLGFIGIKKDLTINGWINDFLMAIFFLLVGLELKREILVGELSTKRKFVLPLIAAIGGVVFPIIIFILFNFNHPENLRGFPIPAATDIAFAYGIISLFGKSFSNSLKVFLVALAIIDDLIAILIITFFYSHDLNLSYIALAIVALFGLGLLNFFKSYKIHLYLLLGLFLWLMILKSGIHPTLTGVLLALFIPLQINNISPLSRLAHKISPTVNFLILPIFAFANAGINLKNFSLTSLFEPLVLGISLGLFFGKQIGITLFSLFAVKFNFANLPRGTNWLEFYAGSIVAGVGFTMSLFIGSLAFNDNLCSFYQVKIGVIIGSLLSAIFASIICLSLKKRKKYFTT
ncbi:MAG: Na+/H+ antiporter NhaA [Proteobacteria bacterium]|nr:Na+/H+ antiporter NhaA [Pseudomonadota bacterium]